MPATKKEVAKLKAKEARAKLKAKRPLKVFKLFSTPGKWTRYADARTVDDVVREANAKDAHKFCARGGVIACYFPNMVGSLYNFHFGPDSKQFGAMMKKLADTIKKLHPKSFVNFMGDDESVVLSFNDHSKRRVSEVRAVFKEAGL